MTNQLIALYHWLLSNPGTVVFWGAVLVAVSYIIGAFVFAAWAASEERRQERQRADFDRIMAASSPPREWPPRPSPKGFNRNGGRMAS